MAEALPTFLATPVSLRLTNGGETVFTITNKEPKSITFKVKTTTPTRYVVRPRIGVIGANSAVLVTIQHRPPAPGDPSPSPPGLSLLRDRFKVEAVFLPAGSAETDDATAKVWAAKPKSKEVELQCEVSLTATPAVAVPPPAPVVVAVPKTVLPIPTPIAPSPALPAPSTAIDSRQEMELRVQRSKETEDGLRQQIAKLESELKTEKNKLEEVLNTARARERAVQALNAKAAKGMTVPLRTFLPLLLLTFIVAYLYGSGQSSEPAAPAPAL